MDHKWRSEIVNLARSYERILAERGDCFSKIRSAVLRGVTDERDCLRKDFDIIQLRLNEVERLLLDLIYYGPDKCFGNVRVDDVVYVAESSTSLHRIRLVDVQDLAADPDVSATTGEEEGK